ncbi:hypothetical protein GKZ28_06830 [Clostridium chromiireducens]|uniref:Putative heavy-metal chelation domain-containing protein n=1 Tax=Clostridium chromiireducens TaxID=225345 RepID=A0A964RKV0_9CLOT|nr:DUF364 domain-containing protein [Clostridium chromiireducens]MVX63407.1 hypothetical protein [Clostridium chromiireducens]
MSKDKFYNNLINRFMDIVTDNNLLEERIRVGGITLSPLEAIGNTEKEDFPIVKGKEKLIEVTFKGEKGQAFTDMPSNFTGTLKEIIEMPLESNFNRAIYIATLNAVCRYLKLTDNTIHCRDNGPEKCAVELESYLESRFGNPKIALIGFQPSMLDRLSKSFKVRVIDLDKNNINTVKYGVLVEDGEKDIKDLLTWCDVIVATGSTIANSTITSLFVDDKPTIFFGTTLAGAAAIMGLERFCPCSK